MSQTQDIFHLLELVIGKNTLLSVLATTSSKRAMMGIRKLATQKTTPLHKLLCVLV